MRISIFHLEHNKTYKEEYHKMIKVLGSKCITFEKKEYSYFDFINNYLFNNWKFRGTYLDCYEYLETIGINIKSRKITKEAFINFLEFILNIQLLIQNLKYYSDKIEVSIKCNSILKHNIPLILESYGYQAYSLDDRIIILEKDLSYDSLMNILPNDIYELLLSYKSLKNNGIKMKRLILYKLYQHLINNIEKYKTNNSSIFSSIRLIITKMGIYKEIDKKYQNLSNYKLRKYYDYCFEMIVYLFNTENILKYKEEIKNENI